MFLSIIIFIITLMILVIIHEFGHFIMCKKFGIKVLEFGFGLPPKIWGKKYGETEYTINALPIGGFVRPLGEDEVNKKILANPRSFAYKPVSKRIIVVIAGVIMNLILAWILFYIVIIGQNFRIIYPTIQPEVIIQNVEKGFPAESAGIKSGDRLLAVDGTYVNDFEQARTLIKKRGTNEVNLTLSDVDGKNIRYVVVKPKEVKQGETLIGVVFSPIAFKQYSTFSEKLFSGITYSWDLTRLTITGLGQLVGDLFKGQFNRAGQSVAGPVGVGVAANNILSLGSDAVFPYIWFTGIISLTLSIMNLLPIPALDGGRLFFLLVEAVTRRRVHAEFEKWVHTIGFAALLALTLLITYSDIRKILF